MECHTPAKDGKTLYEQDLGMGGKPYGPGLVRDFPADLPGSISRNITSHSESGIGSDCEWLVWSGHIKKFIVSNGS